MNVYNRLIHTATIHLNYYYFVLLLVQLKEYEARLKLYKIK